VWPPLDEAVRRGISQITVNTNASLLDEPALARLAGLGAHTRLLVSVDGPPGVHEASRRPGLTAHALDILRTAPRPGLDASPATILTRELIAFGVAPWLEWLDAHLQRPASLVLWPLFLHGGATGASVGTPPEHADYAEAARQVAALLASGRDVVIADHPPVNPLLRRLGVPAERLWQCGAGRERLCVQADATVTPCHPLRHAIDRLEPGRVGGFVARAFAHKDLQRIAARDADECRGCVHTDICGGCRAAVAGRGLPLFQGSTTGVARCRETRTTTPAEVRA
jgi:radical SAM protein with 4Fe4S-binding SPASM domain